MTVLSCPIPGCGFNTDDMDVISAAAILNVHVNVHSTSPTAHPLHGAPNLKQSKIGLHATTED